GVAPRPTAGCTARGERGWVHPLAELPKVVEQFTAAPNASRFAPVHRIGEPFQERHTNDEKLPLEEVQASNTLADLAAHVYHVPLAAFVEMNPGVDPRTPLAANTEVAVPDSKFTPLLAARLAAGALAQTTVAARPAGG